MLELGVELATVSWSQVVFFLLLALGISFLCSLLEAVLLSANWTYIEKQGDPSWWIAFDNTGTRIS